LKSISSDESVGWKLIQLLPVLSEFAPHGRGQRSLTASVPSLPFHCGDTMSVQDVENNAAPDALTVSIWKIETAITIGLQ